jgi:diaminopimelate epimerase
MNLKFFKMQAQGNDYIFFDFINNSIPDLNFSELAVKLSARHTGIGSDGIVLLLPDTDNDVFMRIFNADGSEAENCGSALRCITHYLHDLTGKFFFRINSLSGIKNGKVLPGEKIEISLGKPLMVQSEYKLNNYSGDIVELGNSHFVIYGHSLPAKSELAEIYQLCQNNSNTRNSNLEYARVISPHEIEILIWEKGSGATLACGTGAAASVFAGLRSGFLQFPVKVKLPGGEVTVNIDQGNLSLAGRVDYVYSGEVSI